jgi:cyanobactin maturation PatA/PatG family protease
VIEPQGPYARECFDLVRQFLREQLTENVERISLPGVLTGSARLRAGFSLPVVNPEIRGMYSWSTKALVQSVLTRKSAAAKERDAAPEQVADGVHRFLDRVYYGLRNIGQSSQDRAINFASTNAVQLEPVFAAAARELLELDSVSVEPNPIFRPGSDCWDVQLSFFSPTASAQSVRKVFRFTVDVSDVVPVNVSSVRSWFTR